MKEHYVFFDEGDKFGKGGEWFERMNIACPSSTLRNGLERIREAVEEIRKERSR